MNSENGGPSSSERQRQAAAEIARKNVLAAYSSYQPKPSTPAENAAANAAQAKSSTQNADWKRYHTAWQNYYQKYYSDYYSKAAREYIAGERQKLAAERAKLAENQPVFTPRPLAGSIPYFQRPISTVTPVRSVENSAKTVENPVEKSVENSTPPAASTPAITTTPAAPQDDAQNFFGKRLKHLMAKKAAKSEKQRTRRYKLMPLFAGASVVLALLFLQYNRLIFAPIAAYVSPGEAPAGELQAVDPTITSSVSADPKLIIPRLNVEVPVAFGITLAEINKAMLTGVAQFRIQGASAFPGEIGNLVISGHSSGDIYSSMQYKFIFSGLERLDAGDLIYINYKSTRYTYRVTKKNVVEPTDIDALTQPTDKPMLILVTCTPLGTSRYRLLVYAEQISPSYDEATKSDDATVTEATGETALPKSEPTFFERIWNWITGR